MKNKSIIIVCIVLIIIIVLASFLIINNSNNVETNVVEPSNKTNISFNIDNEKNEKVSSYGKYLECVIDETNNVFPYERTDLNTHSDTLNIGGKEYVSIDTIGSEKFEGNNSLYALENEEDLFKEDIIIYDFEESDKIFKSDKEILPSRLYLMDTNQNAYYKYYGVTYYIPIEHVNSKEEERIVYSNGFTIMRNTGRIYYNGLELQTNYHIDNSGSIEDDLVSLFDCYYLQEDSDQKTYKVYQSDLSTKFNEEFYFTSIDSSNNTTALSKVFIGLNDSSVFKCIVPSDILGNIRNYRNAFYCSSNSNLLNINSISNEYIPFDYYIYDEENGFIKKSAFELIDINSIVGKSITLNKDYSFDDYSIDGEMNKDLQNEEKVSYYFILGNKPENIIPKGTSLNIEKILDKNGSAILKYNDDLFLVYDN